MRIYFNEARASRCEFLGLSRKEKKQKYSTYSEKVIAQLKKDLPKGWTAFENDKLNNGNERLDVPMLIYIKCNDKDVNFKYTLHWIKSKGDKVNLWLFIGKSEKGECLGKFDPKDARGMSNAVCDDIESRMPKNRKQRSW